MLLELTDIAQRATAQFWYGRGVRAAYLPVTTGSISSPMGLGSDSTPVKVELQGVPTYLADSMQFLLEYGCRMNEAGCYYIMPSFRGEAPDETHLCQFYHSEAEISGGLEDVVATVEDYVRALAAAYLEAMAPVINEVAGDTAHIERVLALPAFPRITNAEAIELLGGPNSEYVTEVAPGARTINRAGERVLMNHFGEFVWLTHHDHLAVPFYQAYEPGTGRTIARSADLLFGIGETVGCGERHTDAAQVRDALDLHGVHESDYAWYLKMREIRPMQTSGFGLGIERFFMWLLRHDDIRDLQMLHRVNGVEITP